MTYRETDFSAECESLRRRVKELEARLGVGLLPFGSPCPACGSNARHAIDYTDDTNGKRHYKTHRFVPEKTSRLWRKGNPAHLRSTCANCNAVLREAPKGAP